MRSPLAIVAFRSDQQPNYSYRSLRRRLWRAHVRAFTVYLVISLALVGWPVLAHPETVHVGLGPDPSVMMWCMVWWPYAISHHLNPFVTYKIWAPAGFNLTWSTSIPAVALALTPITSAFGPVVAYNVAAVLALPLSAWSAFSLCRWLTGNFIAAFAGGLLYGFSPYEMGHVLGGHLSYTVNIIPPFCLLLFGRLLEATIAHCRFILGFAALLAIQCLVSTEVFATMTVFGALAWLSAYFLSSAGQRAKLLATMLPLAGAYLASAAIVAPFFYFAFAHGAAPRQPLLPSSVFSADLLGFMIPNPLLLFASHSIEVLMSRSFGIIENEFYFGLPLLILIGRFFWARRSEFFIRFLGLMLGVVVVSAIGPVLHIADHALIKLPWAFVFELPVLKQALPVRLANYGFLIAALIVAMSLAPPKLRFSNVLAAYGIAALLPNPSMLLWPGRYMQPAFFSRGLYRKVLHKGENIVVFPYGAAGPSMLWQAEAGMYFSMSGGYAGPTPEEFQRWPIVNAGLFGLPLADSARQLRSFFAAHHVEAVVAAEGAGPLPASLGIRPIVLGGVSVYQLPPSIAAAVSDRRVDELEESAAQQWIGELLEAARRFLAAGESLTTLNPVRLQQLGLLPDSKWGRRLDFVLDFASHGAITGLWIGPGPNATVAVGLFASSATAAVLAACYQGQAISILYPYPKHFSGTLLRDRRVDFLLITMPLDNLRRVSPEANSFQTSAHSLSVWNR